jgi:hypothetical protein
MTAEPVNREALALKIREMSRGRCEVVAYHKVYAVTEAAALEIADVLLSRPQLVAETVEAREFIENWFAPWGSWKTAWWEMAVGDDVEMTDANALKALRKILAARPSAHGEAG